MVLFIMLYKVVLTFEFVDEIRRCDICFPVVMLIMLYKVFFFEPVNEILKCDHSNESYRAVLSSSIVYYTVQLDL